MYISNFKGVTNALSDLGEEEQGEISIHEPALFPLKTAISQGNNVHFSPWTCDVCTHRGSGSIRRGRGDKRAPPARPTGVGAPTALYADLNPNLIRRTSVEIYSRG
ncbi:hypothetical protein EVAR_44320_1 [Eumeta japonica]|uniref:Uncharacterized protein n=1 Tax=Eumeta variegata TaxID=151549 RepID=A0A4C1X7J4_EUMVA|nr:hypothetical protein EVAR_44320_1 [Eumeta japonica]